MNLTKTSILASFATIKILNDTKKYNNPYQILSEFINYIICTEKIYTFNSIEMKNYLKSIFGFDIPEAVVKTSTKNLSYLNRNDGIYTVDRNGLAVDDSFEATRISAETTNTNIIESLVAYIESKESGSVVDRNILTQDFIAFVVDDQQRTVGKYTDLISEFILKNENNVNMQNDLRTIQEGSILYIGLNHNINETGSITKKLTLFLSMEILFSLVGFNGTIHQRLAEEFLVQVKNANLNGQKIFLRYFSEVKEEIDSYFDNAEMIVDGKMQPMDRVAMKAIINNCNEVSDVTVKKSDFYHSLQYRYGILEDNKNDYYSVENNINNLESIEYTDPQIQASWKYISHINKLRKGQIFSNNIESEYILITNTRSALNASKEQADKDKVTKNIEQTSDYALSLNKITNILWYKLGNGFGRKEYPTNIDTVLRARIVLASSISQNVTEIYNKAKSQHKKGEISDEQLAARIIMLRKKPLLPEELEGDVIEESMDFSPDYISRFEQEINENKAALEKKDKEIEQIINKSQKIIVEKENTIAEKEQLIIQKSQENEALNVELKKYKEKEDNEKAKKEKRKRIWKIIWSIGWRVSLYLFIGMLAYKAYKYDKELLGMFLSISDVVLLLKTGLNKGIKFRRKHKVVEINE
ncbi:MAG: hypothetical protein IJN22_01855 [Clostridia bacterium]|nr:hypothetical protein [Clostridia bacterium]